MLKQGQYRDVSITVLRNQDGELESYMLRTLPDGTKQIAQAWHGNKADTVEKVYSDALNDLTSGKAQWNTTGKPSEYGRAVTGSSQTQDGDLVTATPDSPITTSPPDRVQNSGTVETYKLGVTQNVGKPDDQIGNNNPGKTFTDLSNTVLNPGQRDKTWIENATEVFNLPKPGEIDYKPRDTFNFDGSVRTAQSVLDEAKKLGLQVDQSTGTIRFTDTKEDGARLANLRNTFQGFDLNYAMGKPGFFEEVIGTGKPGPDLLEGYKNQNLDNAYLQSLTNANDTLGLIGDIYVAKPNRYQPGSAGQFPDFKSPNSVFGGADTGGDTRPIAGPRIHDTKKPTVTDQASLSIPLFDPSKPNPFDPTVSPDLLNELAGQYGLAPTYNIGSKSVFDPNINNNIDLSNSNTFANFDQYLASGNVTIGNIQTNYDFGVANLDPNQRLFDRVTSAEDLKQTVPGTPPDLIGELKKALDPYQQGMADQIVNSEGVFAAQGRVYPWNDPQSPDASSLSALDKKALTDDFNTANQKAGYTLNPSSYWQAKMDEYANSGSTSTLAEYIKPTESTYVQNRQSNDYLTSKEIDILGLRIPKERQIQSVITQNQNNLDVNLQTPELKQMAVAQAKAKNFTANDVSIIATATINGVERPVIWTSPDRLGRDQQVLNVDSNFALAAQDPNATVGTQQARDLAQRVIREYSNTADVSVIPKNIFFPISNYKPTKADGFASIGVDANDRQQLPDLKRGSGVINNSYKPFKDLASGIKETSLYNQDSAKFYEMRNWWLWGNRENHEFKMISSEIVEGLGAFSTPSPVGYERSRKRTLEANIGSGVSPQLLEKGGWGIGEYRTKERRGEERIQRLWDLDYVSARQIPIDVLAAGNYAPGAVTGEVVDEILKGPAANRRIVALASIPIVTFAGGAGITGLTQGINAFNTGQTQDLTRYNTEIPNHVSRQFYYDADARNLEAGLLKPSNIYTLRSTLATGNLTIDRSNLETQGGFLDSARLNAQGSLTSGQAVYNPPTLDSYNSAVGKVVENLVDQVKTLKQQRDIYQQYITDMALYKNQGEPDKVEEKLSEVNAKLKAVSDEFKKVTEDYNNTLNKLTIGVGQTGNIGGKVDYVPLNRGSIERQYNFTAAQDEIKAILNAPNVGKSINPNNRGGR